MLSSVSVKPENNQVNRYKSIVKEYFSKEEIQELLAKSNWRGAWEVIKVWSWIVGAMGLVVLWTNPLTVILALIIVGAKQLACAIIMHDASHYSLFKSRKLNDLLGNWFGAFPIIHNIRQYRPYHFRHHIATGTEEDPDINLTKAYPTSKKSLTRKFLRDLSGLSGLKAYYGLIAMHIGILKYNLGNHIEKVIKEDRGYLWKSGFRNLIGPVVSNLIIFLICWLIGFPLLYLIWFGSLFTTYMFFLRVRSIAEHSMVEDSRDPLLNTRTIRANFLERLLFAPLHVNYHLEHHLLFTVPSYNFKSMHKKLKDRGLYKKANFFKGYRQIIRMAMSRV